MPDIKKPDLGWYSKLIRRLCGPIEPYGESNYDRDVYDNLQNYYAVMDCCLVQLRKFVECKSRVEASMKSC